MILSVDSVLLDAQMAGDINGSEPRLGVHGIGAQLMDLRSFKIVISLTEAGFDGLLNKSRFLWTAPAFWRSDAIRLSLRTKQGY